MIHVTSFGYLHGDRPAGADLVLDARHLIRDPHVDPALREMTGKDEAVQLAVMATPGASALLDLLVQAVTGHAAHAVGMDVWVAIGCQGGRHRSVVLADQLASVLFAKNYSVDVWHRDVEKAVVKR